MTAAIRVFLASLGLHVQLYLLRPERLMNLVISPAAMAFLTALVLLGSRDPAAAFYGLVGSGLGTMWATLLGASTFALFRQRQFGTLELLVGSPAPLAVVVAGYVCGEVLMAFAALVLSMAVALALLGPEVRVAAPEAFAVSLGLGAVGLLATGLVIAPVMTLSRSMVQWVNALDYPVWILGGFLFPVALLPPYVTPLSYLLPPYWTARALRLAAAGAGPAELWPAWSATGLLSLLALGLSAWLFRLVGRRLRATPEIALD